MNVCLATSTASGKSLAFMAVAGHLLASNPTARVLALYPARALVQDQIDRWQSFLRPLGVSTALIDGGVDTQARPNLLANNRVVLMTPDVAHAWLLGRAAAPENSRFLDGLRLLVLDEAHVYDGVFGTNMSFFLRRLTAVAGRYGTIVATATLGDASSFVARLTGQEFVILGPQEDGSVAPVREILLVRCVADDPFRIKAQLLERIAEEGLGRFLAFADSRRLVERLTVRASRRQLAPEADSEPADPDDEREEDQIAPPAPDEPTILPYRAGYEAEDRIRIQQALTEGRLSGVVSTSALELGLDIGEIDIVVLLNPPTSVKAFWQRLGRAGRAREGYCIVIDDRGLLAGTNESLRTYMARPLEPNWLYLDNQNVEVTVRQVRYAPVGLMYDLDLHGSAPTAASASTLVRNIEPLADAPMQWFNAMTGEARSLDAGLPDTR